MAASVCNHMTWCGTNICSDYRKFDHTLRELNVLVYLLLTLNKFHNFFKWWDVKRCEICSKLTIKTPGRLLWRCTDAFIVDFEQIKCYLGRDRIYNYRGHWLRTKKTRYLFTIYSGRKYQFKVEHKTLEIYVMWLNFALNEFKFNRNWCLYGVFIVNFKQNQRNF